jgi:ParB family chromosome partitioning protein
MEEMTASVAKHGILEPILFRVEIEGHDLNSPELGIMPDSPANLYVVAGERRVEAAKKAGLTTIPAIFVEGNHAEIALVENLLRQDLTPVEEAEALDRLLKEQNYTHEQLAGMIGKARNTLTEILSLNRLPQEVRDECRSNTSTARKTLIEIARKKQDRSMITAWNQYKDKLAKAAEGRKKREKVPESASDILKWVSKTVNKLEGLDTSTWTDNEKNALNQTLQNLHESIQSILKPSESS